MRRAIIGLLSAALAVLCVPPSARAQQQRSLWRGLVVAPEQRCSAYNADDYRYPQNRHPRLGLGLEPIASVEDQIVTELGGVYGPYTGRWFASQFETDIEHMVARSEAHDALDPHVAHHTSHPVQARTHLLRRSAWILGAPYVPSLFLWLFLISSNSSAFAFDRGDPASLRNRPAQPDAGGSRSEDLPLQLHLPEFTLQPTQFLTLRCRQTVTSTALVTVRPIRPFPDRGRRGLKLFRQLLWTPTCPDQLHHLVPKLHRIRLPRSSHRDTSFTSVWKCPPTRGKISRARAALLCLQRGRLPVPTVCRRSDRHRTRRCLWSLHRPMVRQPVRDRH